MRISRKSIIFLVGPTAVGKTDAAISLANLIHAEIVSCDSMQVYKGLNIISQGPTAAQRKKAPHHLIGFLPPGVNFNVADYRKLAIKKINSIHKKGKPALLVGGTGLYMKILIDGIFQSPRPDLQLREKLQKQEDLSGKGFLHGKLMDIDPQTAALLHPNDTRRIIRALEVYHKKGIAISELKKKTKGLGFKYSSWASST